jgi:hypothetical protein
LAEECITFVEILQVKKHGTMKPTIVIGDIHGLTSWCSIVEKHPDCRIVFLGDYLDPYMQISKKDLIGNLLAIIDFKTQHPDDVVLLLGNHDVHYFVDEAEVGSRFDLNIAPDASDIFTSNYDLFQLALQDETCIFTHAGIAHSWFVEDFKGDFDSDIAQQLNNPQPQQLQALFSCGVMRSGSAAVGGILWADVRELYEPLQGYTQIVGHNRVRNITSHTNNGGRIIFCDCLFNEHYLKI